MNIKVYEDKKNSTDINKNTLFKKKVNKQKLIKNNNKKNK